MYLSYATRPNIVFAIGQMSKYNSDPISGHIKAAKKVVKYLTGTIYLELVYKSSQSNALVAPSPFGLIRYGDSNYADDRENRKSVVGYCYFLNGVVMTWYSKKHRIVSTLTIEAKYIALGHVIHETI